MPNRKHVPLTQQLVVSSGSETEEFRTISYFYPGQSGFVIIMSLPQNVGGQDTPWYLCALKRFLYIYSSLVAI